MKRGLGFTLLELMIVVAIFGIIAAVGYPQYQEYAREARRTDAMGALLQMANEQEKWYLANNSYSANTSDIWPGVAESPSGLYVISVTSGDANGFTVQAVAQGAQATDDECRTFRLTHAGTRTALDHTGAASNDCWD